MKTFTSVVAAAMLSGAIFMSPATAETAATDSTAINDLEPAVMLTTRPEHAVTIKTYYEQPVYSPSDESIGEIRDVLIDEDGEISALIIGVGGFLGLGEKNVAVPFDAVRRTQRDNDWYLVMNTTKDALEEAPGYRYDSDTGEWDPDV